MNPYARMFLHFLHAITNDRDRVSVFVFGTRLTNITRQLRHRDVDVAMARVADAIKDWSGGTRIGWSLREFNWRWGRRVLGQNACLLLVSDGLDREAGEGLSRGDAAPAQVLQAADLAQSAAALRQVRGAAGGRARDAAARGPLPAGA